MDKSPKTERQKPAEMVDKAAGVVLICQGFSLKTDFKIIEMFHVIVTNKYFNH